MLSAEENDLLTLIDNDSPMALLMRQHWTPVCLSEEVEEPDGKPLRVEAVDRVEKWCSGRPRKGS